MLAVVPLLVAAIDPLTHDPVIYREGSLHIVSPDDLSVPDARAAAKKVKAAWQFDLGVMQWKHPARMEKPLSVRVINVDRMKREHGIGTRASTPPTGARFDIRMDLVGDPSMDVTIAHELGHVQSFRALGRYAANSSVPSYFFEGHGLMMNLFYADHIGLDHHKAMASYAGTIRSFTAEEARAILTDEKYFQVGTAEEKANKVFRMGRMGLFFVEYLRVHKSMPEAVPMMGRVFERVGQGKTYKEAFGETYGISLTRAVSDVCTFLKRTQANPGARMKGTRFEQ